jgi:hypothetical protein
VMHFYQFDTIESAELNDSMLQVCLSSKSEYCIGFDESLL